MSTEEDTVIQTDEATQVGAETDETPETNEGREDTAKYTDADVDRRVSEGIKAFIARKEKEDEEKRRQQEQLDAIREGKYEEALKLTQAKLDAIEAENARTRYEADALRALNEMGMANHADRIIPAADSVDKAINLAKTIQEAAERQAQELVLKKLDTGPKRTPDNTHKTPDRPLSELPPEEFEAWKKQNNLV